MGGFDGWASLLDVAFYMVWLIFFVATGASSATLLPLAASVAAPEPVVLAAGPAVAFICFVSAGFLGAFVDLSVA